jgi:hypothetical protein
MKSFGEYLKEDKFDLSKEFDTFNKLYFSGELPKIPVEYKDITPCGTFLSFYQNFTITKYGRPAIDRVQSPNKIYVSSRYKFEYENFRDVLVHEMVHEWFCVHQSKEKQHHGLEFKATIAKMNKRFPELHLDVTVENPEVSKINMKQFTVFLIDRTELPETDKRKYVISVCNPILASELMQQVMKGYIYNKSTMYELLSTDNYLLQYPIARKANRVGFYNIKKEIYDRLIQNSKVIQFIEDMKEPL